MMEEKDFYLSWKILKEKKPNINLWTDKDSVSFLLEPKGEIKTK